MGTKAWYLGVRGPELEQGDILQGIHWVYPLDLTYPIAPDITLGAEEVDAIVLTQTCDLANSKVDHVLLAMVKTYKNLVEESPKNTHLASSAGRKSLRLGNEPGRFLLPANTTKPAIDYSVVLFSYLFTLPKAYVEGVAGDISQRNTRLRLKSPYREHLAHAFGNSVSRVALPLPASDEFDKMDPKK